MMRRYTLHPTPYTLHPGPYTLHPTPYTLHPTPYSLQGEARHESAGNVAILDAVDPKLKTLNSEP